jgi:DNA-binding GntR family transcriptional regulator
MSGFRVPAPRGIDPVDGSGDRADSLYETIRDDIIAGRLKPNERLVVADLAAKHGTSTNPIREVLQLLRGEGYVVFAPNRGARVRPIDDEFIRNIYEISALIEPELARWFVGMATHADVAELERIQGLIEKNNFADPLLHNDLDIQFHTVIYERHYNRQAVEIWWKYRVVLWVVPQRYTVTLARRTQIVREHRELIQFIKDGDADKAAALTGRHVEGASRHLLEHMRAASAARAS